MRKPPVNVGEQHWRTEIRSLWGKVDVVDTEPALDDMEVEDIKCYNPDDLVAANYKLYVKVDQETIAVFCGCALINAEFDQDAFDEGFRI